MVVTKRDGKWVLDGVMRGRRIRRYFASRDEAETLKRELLTREIVGGESKKAMPIKESIRDYVDNGAPRKGKQTKVNEKRYFESFYEFMCADEMLDYVHEIELRHIEKFQTLEMKRVSNSTVNRTFSTYKAYLNRCVRLGFIEKSPAQYLKQLPVKKNVRAMWTQAEMQMMYDALPDWAKDVFLMLTQLGMRPGEPNRLRWCDVDLEQGLIRVSSIKGDGNERVRMLPLTEPLLEMMSKRKRGPAESLVFTQESGGIITTSAFAHAVKRTREALGMKKLVPYGLRHTFITRLSGQHRSTLHIMAIAGHERVETTQIYTHVSPSDIRASITSVSKGLEIVRTSK